MSLAVNTFILLLLGPTGTTLRSFWKCRTVDDESTHDRSVTTDCSPSSSTACGVNEVIRDAPARYQPFSRRVRTSPIAAMIRSPLNPAASSGARLGLTGSFNALSIAAWPTTYRAVAAVMASCSSGVHVGVEGGEDGVGVAEGDVDVVLGRPASGEPWQAVSARRAQMAAVA